MRLMALSSTSNEVEKNFFVVVRPLNKIPHTLLGRVFHFVVGATAISLGETMKKSRS